MELKDDISPEDLSVLAKVINKLKTEADAKLTVEIG